MHPRAERRLRFLVRLLDALPELLEHVESGRAAIAEVHLGKRYLAGGSYLRVRLVVEHVDGRGGQVVARRVATPRASSRR